MIGPNCFRHALLSLAKIRCRDTPHFKSRGRNADWLLEFDSKSDWLLESPEIDQKYIVLEFSEFSLVRTVRCYSCPIAIVLVCLSSENIPRKKTRNSAPLVSFALSNQDNTVYFVTL